MRGMALCHVYIKIGVWCLLGVILQFLTLNSSHLVCTTVLRKYAKFQFILFFYVDLINLVILALKQMFYFRRSLNADIWKEEIMKRQINMWDESCPLHFTWAWIPASLPSNLLKKVLAIGNFRHSLAFCKGIQANLNSFKNCSINFNIL